jgi:hypothetical protein
MIELVFWSFVITLPPLLLSVGIRILSVLAEVITWYGARREALSRHIEPTFQCVARRVNRPESFGHGV